MNLLPGIINAGATAAAAVNDLFVLISLLGSAWFFLTGLWYWRMGESGPLEGKARLAGWLGLIVGGVLQSCVLVSHLDIKLIGIAARMPVSTANFLFILSLVLLLAGHGIRRFAA